MGSVPRLNAQREIELFINAWGGLNPDFPSSLQPYNEFADILNFDFITNREIKSRGGTIEYMSNAQTGNTSILAGVVFPKTSITSVIIFATSDGKLYELDLGLGKTPSLIGNLTNNALKNVVFAVMANNLYIADGYNPWKYDGTNLTNIKNTFPSISPLTVGNINWVTASLNKLWWTDQDTDYVYYSSFNNPDDLTTESTGAGLLQIQYGDNTKLTSILDWGRSLVVNKSSSDGYSRGVYIIEGIGTTQDPHTVYPISGSDKTSLGFIGQSAVQVGSDLVGLVPGYIVSLQAIENFQKLSNASLTNNLQSIIDTIVLTNENSINAVYHLNKYYLAAPFFGGTRVNRVLVFDTIVGKWTMYDNWDVSCFIKVGKDLLFGTNDGKILRTNSGNTDTGSSFTKSFTTLAHTYGTPDENKMFKSVEFEIIHDFNFNFNYFYILEGESEKNGGTVSVSDSNISTYNGYLEYNDPVTGFYNNVGKVKTGPLILDRGKSLAHKFTTTANVNFSIRNITTRFIGKDSGSDE